MSGAPSLLASNRYPLNTQEDAPADLHHVLPRTSGSDTHVDFVDKLSLSILAHHAAHGQAN